jgi:crotonobetainyl-CoA:carnitine CoA-transferase CaiB-like acyl-CoA transferase
LYKLLNGIRVLEVSLITPDQVGMFLADLGAEVLKVEQPPEGDYVREIGGERLGGVSILHLAWNRGKKSVGVNLKTPAGRELFLELAKQAHVVLDGLRAGSIERFGIGYEAVRRVNPKIVFVSMNATGQSGPYRELATHATGPDAFAGLIAPVIRPDGLPTFPPVNPRVGMTAGPIYATIGALAGIIQALQSGEGARIEVAMFDAAAAFTADGINAVLNNCEVEFVGLEDAVRHQFYRTKDDKFIIFQCSEDKFWVNFCELVGRTDLLEGHERKAVASHARGDIALRRELAAILATRTRAEWIDLFIQHNIAGTPANTPEELLEDPHFRARALTYEVETPGVGPTRWFTTAIKAEGQRFDAAPAPTPGLHTEEVLRAVLGVDDARLAELRANGAI